MLLFSLAAHATVINWLTGISVPPLSGLASGGFIYAMVAGEGTPATAAARQMRATHAAPERKIVSGVLPREQAAVNEQPSGSAGPEVLAEDQATDSLSKETAVAVPQEEITDSGVDENDTEDVPAVTPAGAADVLTPPHMSPPGRERFYFELYWLGIYVGQAVLEASREDGLLRISSQVHSAPFISTFYKVDDFAESTLRGGVPVRFRIKQREGKYRSDKETIFDAGKGMVTYFDYLKGIKDEHAVPGKMLWDVISGFFYLRSRPMEVGKPVPIDIFDSNKFLTTEVNILRNEKVRFLDSETDAVVVRPVLKSDGLFQSKGDIYIWLTDDERRIPVKVETRVSIGTVVAELKGMEREP